MKRVRIQCTNELLGDILKIKNGINLISTQTDTFLNTTDILLESENFEYTQEGSMPIIIDMSDILDVPTYKYKTVLANDLSYSEAMFALKNGKAVTRKSWFGYWEKETITGLTYPIIVATTKDGARVPATPYQEDMLATDWMTVIPKATRK